MDERTQALLAEIQEQGRRHDEQEPEHSKRFLNLEPDTAHFVSILVRTTRRTSVLEIGTSNGYSTIWLADALRKTGGRLITVDRDVGKHALAEANLRRAGLRDVVDLVQVEALPGFEALTIPTGKGLSLAFREA